MRDLPYRLVILTHGDSATLPAALAAFDEHVTPAPTETALVYDGPMPSAPVEDFIREREGNSWWSMVEGAPAGFCAATRYAWAIGAQPGVTHTFWLEHDFLVSRPVDLRDFAAVLDDKIELAQMALMRDAYSKEEKAAGGLFEYRRSDFDTRFVTAPPRCQTGRCDRWCPECRDAAPPIDTRGDWLAMPWWTSNPHLAHRDFMADHPFPDDGEPFCEGRFGIALREQGFEFGTWGDGSVYCNHVGFRSGTGY